MAPTHRRNPRRGLPESAFPAEHGHIKLLRCLGVAARRAVWSGVSDRWSDRLLIVELLIEPAELAGSPERGRVVLDLRAWSMSGWPPAAVVTLLPTPLPAPYDRVELLSFIGQGGMGQVWMGESTDFPDVALAVKLVTHPFFERHPQLLETCLQEARVGILLDSPHVVRTFQLLDLRGHPEDGWPPLGLVMPLCEPSLERVLEDARTHSRRLPAAVTRRVTKHLLKMPSRIAWPGPCSSGSETFKRVIPSTRRGPLPWTRVADRRDSNDCRPGCSVPSGAATDAGVAPRRMESAGTIRARGERTAAKPRPPGRSS